jgi:hypothetical protein
VKCEGRGIFYPEYFRGVFHVPVSASHKSQDDFGIFASSRLSTASSSHPLEGPS